MAGGDAHIDNTVDSLLFLPSHTAGPFSELPANQPPLVEDVGEDAHADNH